MRRYVRAAGFVDEHVVVIELAVEVRVDDAEVVRLDAHLLEVAGRDLLIAGDVAIHVADVSLQPLGGADLEVVRIAEQRTADHLVRDALAVLGGERREHVVQLRRLDRGATARLGVCDQLLPVCERRRGDVRGAREEVFDVALGLVAELVATVGEQLPQRRLGLLAFGPAGLAGVLQDVEEPGRLVQIELVLVRSGVELVLDGLRVVGGRRHAPSVLKERAKPPGVDFDRSQRAVGGYDRVV